MKIILYKSISSGYEHMNIYKGKDRYPCNDDENVMLSEPLGVEFTMLNDKTIVNNQVAILDRQMVKVRANAQASITALEGKKQELLALENIE